jgi:hypothetical protein
VKQQSTKTKKCSKVKQQGIIVRWHDKMKEQGKAIRCDNKAKQWGVTTKQHNKTWSKAKQNNMVKWQAHKTTCGSCSKVEKQHGTTNN